MILAAERDGTDGALDGIVVDFDAAVVEVEAKRRPARKRVADRFGELAAPGNAGEFGFEPGLERLLFRLLRLLESAADDGIKHLSPPKGRKRNYPVENFARRAAFVWAHLLGRPFTVDYNQGVGASRAFVFVRTLLDRLDADVPDAEIITGMRTVIAELRDMKLGRKSAPNKNSE
jgi:hypothetical protein